MKIVFLCVDVPFNFTKASEYRHHQMIEALKENHSVKVIVLNSKNVKEYKEKYGTDAEAVESYIPKIRQIDYFRKSLILPRFPKPHKKGELEDLIRDFAPDIVFYTSVGFYPYVKNISAKKVFSVNKVLYMYYQRLALIENPINGFLLRKRCYSIGAWEKRAFMEADMILFSVINDMANVNSNMQLLTPSYYLPAYIDKVEFCPLCQKKNIIVYGNYKSIAGKLMIKYFLDSIHPLLKKTYQDYKVYIVGNGAKSIEADSNTEVREVLWEDVLKDARALFLPYRVRTDMQYPAIKAMSYGVPIIGYDKTMDFFAVKRKDDYCITAKSPGELQNKFIRAFNNDADLERVREKAFNYVKDHYSKESFDKTLADCIENLKERTTYIKRKS